MEAEVRADGLHISGYVNVPGRASRPLSNDKHGKFIEVIEQRAFQRAIDRAGGLDMLLDHDRKIASTSDSTLKVWEDEIGLRAQSVISDPEVVESAKKGKLRGWSFNMYRVLDQLEERAEGLPIRHIKDFDMSEISLIINKVPCYQATSVEVRAGEELEIEQRAGVGSVTLKPVEKPKETIDYSEYEKEIRKLKGE